jgi:hypothetical protein
MINNNKIYLVYLRSDFSGNKNLQIRVPNSRQKPTYLFFPGIETHLTCLSLGHPQEPSHPYKCCHDKRVEVKTTPNFVHKRQ